VTAIAVVVPALDEAGNIGMLLEDLRRQRRAPDEVLVVDAGSRDGTAAVVEGMAADWPALRLVHRPGAPPGAARNAGIIAASAPVIATLDAGSRVGPEWLDELAAPVLEAPGRVAVGTAIADARSSFETAAGWFTLRAFKPVDAPGPVGRSFLPAGRNGVCFRSEAWEAAGGYPERLPWGEDKRFLTRLRALGCAVHASPRAVVRWRPRERPSALYRQYERYGRGDALARVDRQNELIPLALMTVGGGLAWRALRGEPRAAVLLAAGAAGYLGIFTAAAARELDDPRAVAWVPVIRLLVDTAKVHGFLAESMRSRPVDI
jgi:glycosyltransferase involved in cell wall biosynthesis